MIFKIILIGILIICSNSYSYAEFDNLKYIEESYINNCLDIEVISVEVKQEGIYLDQMYNAYADVVFSVKNNSNYNIELSNLDIYTYQGDKITENYINTSNKDSRGFYGNLGRGENRYVQIGVSLHNLNDNLRIEINNEDTSNTYIHKISN